MTAASDKLAKAIAYLRERNLYALDKNAERRSVYSPPRVLIPKNVISLRRKAK